MVSVLPPSVPPSCSHSLLTHPTHIHTHALPHTTDCWRLEVFFPPTLPSSGGGCSHPTHACNLHTLHLPPKPHFVPLHTHFTWVLCCWWVYTTCLPPSHPVAHSFPFYLWRRIPVGRGGECLEEFTLGRRPLLLLPCYLLACSGWRYLFLPVIHSTSLLLLFLIYPCLPFHTFFYPAWVMVNMGCHDACCGLPLLPLFPACLTTTLLPFAACLPTLLPAYLSCRCLEKKFLPAGDDHFILLPTTCGEALQAIIHCYLFSNSYHLFLLEGRNL